MPLVKINLRKNRSLSERKSVSEAVRAALRLQVRQELRGHTDRTGQVNVNLAREVFEIRSGLVQIDLTMMPALLIRMSSAGNLLIN
jgi:hypothetical protein